MKFKLWRFLMKSYFGFGDYSNWPLFAWLPSHRLSFFMCSYCACGSSFRVKSIFGGLIFLSFSALAQPSLFSSWKFHQLVFGISNKILILSRISCHCAPCMQAFRSIFRARPLLLYRLHTLDKLLDFHANWHYSKTDFKRRPAFSYFNPIAFFIIGAFMNS